MLETSKDLTSGFDSSACLRAASATTAPEKVFPASNFRSGLVDHPHATRLDGIDKAHERTMVNDAVKRWIVIGLVAAAVLLSAVSWSGLSLRDLLARLVR